jgi:asparagine synthase (glutamine-hydrolysing)
MHRFVAITWDPLSLDSVHALNSLDVASACPSTEWQSAHEGPGTLVKYHRQQHDSTTIYPLHGRAGVVLGRIFNRHDEDYATERAISFGNTESRSILQSLGQHLIDCYWGTYLAVLYDEATNKHHIFRDPVGTLPCYFASHGGVHVFFSHIEDYVHLRPVRFSIDRNYLTRWLFYSNLTTMQTGLEDVAELPAGERLSLSKGTVSHARIWDPVAIASRPNFASAEEAGKVLRSSVQRSVDAWASCYKRITHRLSGGLDSSIVAGCLAQAPSKPLTTYLNLFIDAGFDHQRFHRHGMDPRTEAKVRAIVGHGDERHYVHQVVQRWNVELVQRQRELAMDLNRLWQVPLRTSPALYFTMLEMDDAELELIHSRGTQAFFSGQAGDSVFLGTLQPLPAMDYARLHGLRRGLWRQIVASSTLSRDSLWSVLSKVISHGLLRRPYAPPVSIFDQPTMLNPALAKSLTEKDLSSPLTETPAYSQLPPGKQNHVRGVTWSAYYNFVFRSGQYADHIDPLNSQPVWECLLQLPTYTLLTGGVSRGLARRAFADLLPPEIRKRQVKGTGGSFYQHLVKRNRKLLQSSLLDGELVKDGYLDRPKLEACLTAEDPTIAIPATTLMVYLSAEIWLQQWNSLAQRIAAEPTARSHSVAS